MAARPCIGPSFHATRRRLLPRPRQVLELEAVGGEMHVELDARARHRRGGRRRAVHLHVLGVRAAAPAAGDVHVAVAVGRPPVGDAPVEDRHRLAPPVVLDDVADQPRSLTFCQRGGAPAASIAWTKVLMRAAFTPKSPCPSRDLERMSIRLVPSSSGRTRMAMSSWKPKRRLVAVASRSPADGSLRVTVSPICRATASARVKASGTPARTRAG